MYMYIHMYMCIYVGYIMPTRGDIPEVILNKPEGVARGFINYYRGYIRILPGRHGIACLYYRSHTL